MAFPRHLQVNEWQLARRVFTKIQFGGEATRIERVRDWGGGQGGGKRNKEKMEEIHEKRRREKPRAGSGVGPFLQAAEPVKSSKSTDVECPLWLLEPVQAN